MKNLYSQHKGYICSVNKLPYSRDKDPEYHYIDINWQHIPMLSLITGKNGIGKSTLLKMIPFFFNREINSYKDKLIYQVETRDDIKITDIELMLIHFDNNIVDLKLRKFNDLLNFKDPRSLKYGDPIYNEINLNYQLHKIELISTLLYKESHIEIPLDYKAIIDQIKMFKFYPNNKFNAVLKWKEITKDLDTRIEILIAIFKMNKEQPNSLKDFANLTKLIFNNLNEIKNINTELKANKFGFLIDSIPKTKYFFVPNDTHYICKHCNQSIHEWNCLTFKEISIFWYSINKFIGDDDSEILNMKTSDISEFIKTIIKDESDLVKFNKILQQNNFRYTITLEIFFSLVFTPYNNQCIYQKSINMETLSNGQQIILHSIVWDMFKDKIVKKNCVLILDEPDSHLHPIEINMLICRLKNLVDSGIQIILTTQNPVTLKFIDDENIFVMDYNKEHILELKKSKESKIPPTTLLTNDLVLLNKPFYFVLLPTKLHRMFFEKMQINRSNLKYPIIFKELNASSEEIQISNEKQSSIYNLIRLIDSISNNSNGFLSEELIKLREMVFLRDTFTRNEVDKNILELMEIFQNIKEFDLIFAVLDKRNSQNESSRIIYPERYDLFSYIFDPFHFIFLLKEFDQDNQIFDDFKDIKSDFKDNYQIITNNNKLKLQNLLNRFTCKIIDLANDDRNFENKISSEADYPVSYEINGVDYTFKYPKYFITSPSKDIIKYILSFIEINCPKKASNNLIKMIDISHINESYLAEFLLNLFDDLKWKLLVPQELSDKFSLGFSSNKIEPCKYVNSKVYNGNPELHVYLRKAQVLTFCDLDQKLKNYLQLFVPDSAFKTLLHILVFKKSYKMIK